MLPDRQRCVFHGESREEVRRKLNKAIREVDTGTFIDGRGRRLGDFLDQWLTEAVRPTVRQWTYAGYEVNVCLHIKPVPGAIKLEGSDSS